MCKFSFIATFFIYFLLPTAYLKAQQAFSKEMQLFQSYITGDFDNQLQINLENKRGKQIHPFARHVNRVANKKILNLPEKLNGFFLLEESYYSYPGKEVQIKPYLFFFEQRADGGVRLHSIDLPKELDKKDIRNDNPHLFFEFQALKDSPSFKPADYTLRNDGFYLKATNELPNGMRFTLEETIGKDQLLVMELLEKDGKSLTPYQTPLIYNRLNNARIFQNYLSGSFDNRRQTIQNPEAKAIVHPYAWHVNGLADHKIRDKPAGLKGFYMLVESYYIYPGQVDTTLKPHLFYFEELKNGKIRLNPLKIPGDILLNEIRNDNPRLYFNYNDLKPSGEFKNNTYTLTDKGFYIRTTSKPTKQSEFILEETISENRLEVLELYFKEGKQLTPYSTPIIYERIK